MAELHASVRPGSGTPIVLLHGFGGSSAAWAEVAARLEHGRHVIGYDLPGHGGSLHYPEAGPPKVAAKAVLADFSRRGIASAHLVGHSMGGAIAALIALIEPQRVASLTLLAPGGFGAEINAPLLSRFASAASETEIAACLAAMSAPDSPGSTIDIEEHCRQRAAAGQTAMLKKICALITKDGRQGVIPPDSIAKLEMPVAVAWGDLDLVLPYAQSQSLPPNCRLVTLKGVGHMLPQEATEDVARLIESQANGGA